MQEEAPVETETGEGHVVKDGAVQGALHGFSGVNVFRGAGVAVAKSVELLLLSVQPELALNRARLLDPAGAKLAPSKQLAVDPNPIKSITPVVGHKPDNAVVEFTKDTLPAVADILVEPDASNEGSAEPTAPPVASLTK